MRSHSEHEEALEHGGVYLPTPEDEDKLNQLDAALNAIAHFSMIEDQATIGLIISYAANAYSICCLKGKTCKKFDTLL